MTARIIGQREFTDGSVRAVYEDEDGQFVLDDRGKRVDGVWALPADDPIEFEISTSHSDEQQS